MTSKETVEEAARRWPPGGTGLPFPEYYGFLAGAEWMGAQVEELLRDLEWAGDYLVTECPACHQEKGRGHRQDCKLAAALRTLEGSGQEEEA